MFCCRVSLEKLHSLLKRHKSQKLIKGLPGPAIRKLFNFVKVIVSPNLTDQKELLLFFLLNNTLLTFHGMY